MNVTLCYYIVIEKKKKRALQICLEIYACISSLIDSDIAWMLISEYYGLNELLNYV